MANPPMNAPKPYTATLRTRCGCSRDIKLRYLWPEYLAPLEVRQLSSDAEFNAAQRYDFQNYASEVRHRVFEFNNCRYSEEGTHAVYLERETRCPST